MDIIYVTSNDEKYKIAFDILAPKNINIMRKNLQLNEIQSNSIVEIAVNSAIEASKQVKTNDNIAVTDAGFFITALNGFPGPFVKYINQYLNADNILNILEKTKNREIVVKECLVIIDSKMQKHIYTTEYYGKVALEPAACTGTTFEKIFIPNGYSVQIADLSSKDKFEYWKKGSTWNLVDII